MKRDVKIKILLIFSALLLAPGLRAQVVIGSSSTLSEEAAILQIKEYDAPAGSGGETANRGGILLPRVELKSLSDITVLPPDAPEDKKLNLTGLLVYNVNTSGMDEGIYEWGGTRWYLLEVLSDVSGSYTRKALLRDSITEANAPLLRMGIFEFRISPSPDLLGKKPQYRIAGSLTEATAFWFHVTRYWDFNEMGNPTQPPGVGYSFDVRKETVSPGDATWHDFHTANLKKGDQQFEVWLADPINEHLYNIQFLIFQSASKPTYVILGTLY
jgi:hypothetical protein